MTTRMTEAQAGETEIDVIADIYRNPGGSKELFSAGFLEAVPFAQIEAAIENLRQSYGAQIDVREAGDGYAIETPTHRIPVQITLDAEGRVAGLLFKPAERLTASIRETLDLIAAVPGEVSYLVQSGGDTRFARDAGQKLAVGSAFKLGVLKVLADDIAAGRHTWDEVMRLEDGDRSLPSGQLQTYPARSPLTLHTLAAAMISQSDNTATDALIRLLGRDRIAKALGTQDLLTTRDFFTLKADSALATRYRDGDHATRQAIVEDLAGRPLPKPAQASGPHDEGVEWYVDAGTLCALATELSAIDIFTINPGPVDAANWRSVAYKGGSETGVLNLTAALTGRDGGSHCVSLTVNDDEAIDLAEVSGLFARLTAQLATTSER